MAEFHEEKARIRELVAWNLRTIRERKRKTQKQVAESSGLWEEEISMYENGRRLPSLEIIPRLCSALGVTALSIIPKMEDL